MPPFFPVLGIVLMASAYQAHAPPVGHTDCPRHALRRDSEGAVLVTGRGRCWVWEVTGEVVLLPNQPQHMPCNSGDSIRQLRVGVSVPCCEVLLPPCLSRRIESSDTFSLIVICLIPARRMLEDPTWLGKYLVFVEKFHLQKAPIFNIAGKSCPPAAPHLFKEVLSFSSIP